MPDKSPFSFECLSSHWPESLPLPSVPELAVIPAGRDVGQGVSVHTASYGIEPWLIFKRPKLLITNGFFATTCQGPTGAGPFGRMQFSMDHNADLCLHCLCPFTTPH